MNRDFVFQVAACAACWASLCRHRKVVLPAGYSGACKAMLVEFPRTCRRPPGGPIILAVVLFLTACAPVTAMQEGRLIGDDQLAITDEYWTVTLDDNSMAYLLDGAYVSSLYANDSSTVHYSGGMVYHNVLRNVSTAYVSGGSTCFFYPADYSTVHRHARHFIPGEGLPIVGGRVTGTDMLAMEWFDGTPAVVDIRRIDLGAFILAIPEPGTPGLIMMAVLALPLRRHRDPGRSPSRRYR